MNFEALKQKTFNASQKWKTAFNSKNAVGCADCYEDNAVMTAHPFGTFQGKTNIQKFWSDLIQKGFLNVEYIDPIINQIDEASVQLKSKWKMNKAFGTISNQLWVLQSDGTMKLRVDEFAVEG